jgi:hypothetical protein
MPHTLPTGWATSHITSVRGSISIDELATPLGTEGIVKEQEVQEGCVEV